MCDVKFMSLYIVSPVKTVRFQVLLKKEYVCRGSMNILAEYEIENVCIRSLYTADFINHMIYYYMLKSAALTIHPL